MISPAIDQDGQSIQYITANTSVFTPEEVATVAELWNEYLQRGSQTSGYFFIVDKADGQVRGYACYGPRTLTEGTFDLYWIAVDPNRQREGVGRILLNAVENEVRKLGGRLIFVETSGLEKYASTRRFYLSTGYTQEAVIKDFYTDGDDLVIFTKHL